MAAPGAAGGWAGWFGGTNIIWWIVIAVILFAFFGGTNLFGGFLGGFGGYGGPYAGYGPYAGAVGPYGGYGYGV